MDLDEQELKATRKLHGLDKENKIDEFIKMYNEIKQQSFIIESINKDFFFEFADCLVERVKELEEENLHWKGKYHLITRKIGVIPEQKIKDKIKELTNTKGDFATYIAISERIKVLQELLQEEDN